MKDPTQPQYPALAFSAKFQLTGMTGTFTPAEQSQINGASSLPIGGSGGSTAHPSSSATSPLVSSVTSTPPKSSGTPSSSSVRPSSSGTAQGNSSGALGLTAGKLLTGALATAAGLAIFL